MLSLDQVLAERARRDFYAFVRLAWPWMQPEPFKDNWDIGLVCERLQAVAMGQVRELVICKPPATTKSRVLSCLWPVWLWLQKPAEKVLMASYGEKPMKDFAEHRLRLMQSEGFRTAYPRLVLTKTALEDTGNTGLGWHRFTTAPRGQVTGMHGTIRIIDDPLKPDEVDKSGLEAVNEWFDNTWSSRATEKTTVRDVVSMQRLHDLDLAGICIDRGFEALVIPMEYRKAYAHPRDPRTIEGECLNPVRFPPEVLAKDRVRLGPQVYAAQYQQDPVPDGGAIFQEVWFQRYRVLPPGGTFVHSWDCSFKDEDSSDFVVGQVWYYLGSQYYLVDQVRGRMDFPDTVRAMLRLLERHPASVVLVEDKANGSAVISTLRRKVPGMIAIDPQGGKVARANAVSGVCEAKQVFLPESAEWLADLLRELVRFPMAKNDDQVDAATQALHYMAQRAMDLAAVAANLPDMMDALLGLT